MVPLGSIGSFLDYKSCLGGARATLIMIRVALGALLPPFGAGGFPFWVLLGSLLGPFGTLGLTFGATWASRLLIL